MIKERQLLPGRVIAHVDETYVVRASGEEFVSTWKPCMVVAYQPEVRRRHSKKTATAETWHVLVLWMGEDSPRLETVSINPPDNAWTRWASNNAKWKALW